MFRKVHFSLAHPEEDPKLFTLFFQDWVAVAEQIDCPAPLPEDPESEILTKMMFLAPYEVPEKKAKKAATGTRKGLRRRAVIDSSSEDAEADSSHKDGEEEEGITPPRTGEERREKPPHRGWLGRLRRERHPFWTTPPRSPTTTRSGCPGTSP